MSTLGDTEKYCSTSIAAKQPLAGQQPHRPQCARSALSAAAAAPSQRSRDKKRRLRSGDGGGGGKRDFADEDVVDGASVRVKRKSSAEGRDLR